MQDNKLRISCTQTGQNNQFTQFLSLELTPAIFEREIAPARTFVYYEDVKPLMDKNLIKGGSLENAIVVHGDAVLSKEPHLRARRSRSEEHTSELQSPYDLVCRLLLEKKKKNKNK